MSALVVVFFSVGCRLEHNFSGLIWQKSQLSPVIDWIEYKFAVQFDNVLQIGQNTFLSAEFK